MAKTKSKAKSKKRPKPKASPKRRASSSPAKKKTKKKPTKKAKATGGKSKAKRSGGQSTELERNWSEYWRCRTELEEAVAAVQAAEASLASARELERTRREVFDSTKDALKGPPRGRASVRAAAGGARSGGAVRPPRRGAVRSVRRDSRPSVDSRLGRSSCCRSGLRIRWGLRRSVCP